MFRLGFVAAVLVAALGFTTPSNALQTLTWEFVVDCNNSAGSNSAPLFDMPNGVYAVSVEGACTIDSSLFRTYTFTTGTPCTVPVTGTGIPCVTGGPNVSNIPGPACRTVTDAVIVHTCLGGPIVETNGCTFAIVMDGYACMSLGAGTFYHAGGNMNAKFADTVYGDNLGYFLVTVEWTHL